MSRGELIVALVGNNPNAINICVILALKNGKFLQIFAALLSAKQSRKIGSDVGEIIIKAAIENDGLPSKLETALQALLEQAK